jgi:hypothetical protein
MTVYKKLIVSGCSFTAGDSWAHFLAEKYDLELVNLAVAGAGNKHIADSLILYLEQNNLDINEVLIGAMWSGISRTEWMISFSDQRYSKYHRYNYTNKVSRVESNQILNDHGLSRAMVHHDPDLAMIEIAYSRGDQARHLQGLLSMIYLNSYLNSQGYTFFQTHFFGPDGDKTQSGELHGSRYTDTYNDFKIARPSTGVLNFSPDQFLGNWAVKQKLIWAPNDYHPTVPGHKLWTETVLIPQLIQQKLLTTG